MYAPLDGSFISIEPQFNYDDPFGQEWAKDEDTGMVVLQPGQIDAVEDAAGDIFAELDATGRICRAARQRMSSDG